MNKYKLLRVTADLTQKDFAEILGITPQTVVQWESGKAEPSAKHIRRMCLLYNVSADYLLDIEGVGDDPKKSNK